MSQHFIFISVIICLTFNIYSNNPIIGPTFKTRQHAQPSASVCGVERKHALCPALITSTGLERETYWPWRVADGEGGRDAHLSSICCRALNGAWGGGGVIKSMGRTHIGPILTNPPSHPCSRRQVEDVCALLSHNVSFLSLWGRSDTRHVTHRTFKKLFSRGTQSGVCRQQAAFDQQSIKTSRPRCICVIVCVRVRVFGAL